MMAWSGWVFLLVLAASATAGPLAWKAGPDVPAPQFNLEDADAGVVEEGPNLRVQTALWPHWRRFAGPDLDHLQAQPEAQRDASFSQPNGDDAYWTQGMWKDAAGRFYAVIHVEYHYAAPRKEFRWRRRIGLATSADHGAHWHYVGDILTTDPARDGRPGPGFVDFGCGDTYLFVDRPRGFFYLYYMTAWIDAGTGARTMQVMSVARSPVAAGMAPGSWRKWNGGAWTEPGLGGAEAPVFPGADSSVVHFNTYLRRYVAIGRDSAGSAWITTCASLDREDWQPRDYGFPQRLYWYNWPIDPATHDRFEIGQRFRLYSSQANVGGVASKYFEVTLSAR